MTQIDLSVVIVTWNSARFIGPCLAALHANSDRAFECLLVDNASSDDTVLIVERDYPWVMVLQPGRNLGFAAANNQAMRRSDGDYVLLLNSDALVSEDTVDALVGFMEQRRDVGLAGCKLLNADGSLQQSCYRYATLWRSGGDAVLLTNLLQFLPAIDDYRRFAHDRPRSVSALSGACLMARRAAVARVGLLDERFFMYAEDSDWCRRFWRAGWSVAFTPTTHVTHLGGGSQSGRDARSLALAEEGFRRYMLKYYGPLGCALWSQTALAGSLARWTLQRALRRQGGARRGSGAAHHAARIAWHIALWHRVLRPRKVGT